MPIGSEFCMRFWNMSRSSIWATVMRPVSLSRPPKSRASNHSVLRRTSVRSMSSTSEACST